MCARVFVCAFAPLALQPQKADLCVTFRDLKQQCVRVFCVCFSLLCLWGWGWERGIKGGGAVCNRVCGAVDPLWPPPLGEDCKCQQGLFGSFGDSLKSALSLDLCWGSKHTHTHLHAHTHTLVQPLCVTVSGSSVLKAVCSVVQLKHAAFTVGRVLECCRNQFSLLASRKHFQNHPGVPFFNKAGLLLCNRHLI